MSKRSRRNTLNPERPVPTNATSAPSARRRFGRIGWLFGLLFLLMGFLFLSTLIDGGTRSSVTTVASTDAAPRMSNGEVPASLIYIELTADGQVMIKNSAYPIAATAETIRAIYGPVDMVRIKAPTPVDSAQAAALVSVLGTSGVAKEIGFESR